MSDTTAETIIYPDSDGKPIADNTHQFRAIVTIKENLEALFRDRDDVFVASDLLWYPVEGRPDICHAPDVMVAIGRPKGDRSAYLQWEEGGQPPQVVFEIWSPGNTMSEMARKHEFYVRYGVSEYLKNWRGQMRRSGRKRSSGSVPCAIYGRWGSTRTMHDASATFHRRVELYCGRRPYIQCAPVDRWQLSVRLSWQLHCSRVD
jgi:hypothetical protein